MEDSKENYNDVEYDQIEAHICSLSFPTSLEEMLAIYADDGLYNIEQLLNADYEESEFIWTVPRWCREGDVVLFYHTKTANIRISQINSMLKKNAEYFTEEEVHIIHNMILKGKDLYKKYGGMIFACGVVLEDPYYDSDHDEIDHFRSNILARIGYIHPFESPVHITEVDSFIKIEQRSVTPLFGEAYDRLVDMLCERNEILPEYLMYSESVEPLYTGINKRNWLELNNQNCRRHQFETQFRVFYVDYLLSELCDDKAIYVECPCYKNTRQASYVDNVILFNGKYLPVEVKLNINAERDIKKQVAKYCDTDRLFLKRDVLAPKNSIYNNVMIVDTDACYLYNYNNNEIEQIYSLDNIKNNKDIKKLKTILKNKLGK